MTNLDGILKSRDITLPTKVHIVKAMVFPVVMYGCESWTAIHMMDTGGHGDTWPPLNRSKEPHRKTPGSSKDGL